MQGPGGQRVSISTCTRTGRHLATFTRRPWSSLYTLATEPLQVAASAQVSASGPVAPLCSCHLLSHQTLLWHHRLGHPSLPHLRGMHSRLLVSGLPRSLPPLPPLPAPTYLPCVHRRQRAAPHSSSFPPTTAPLQTIHMDVWGPARVSGQSRERYFLLVVAGPRCLDPLDPHSPSPAPRAVPPGTSVLRLHSDRGGEFSSDLLLDFFRGEGILQSFMLPASPQKNGIAERRIGLVMEVACTSMIHAAAPHFLWPFAVRYTAHQLNVWPRVSLPETSPTLRWKGEVGDASVFRVWGSRAFVRDTSVDKLSTRAIPCVFLGFPPDAPCWQFSHPTSRRVFPSHDVTFDKSVPFYRLFPYRSAPPPPPPLFLAPSPPSVDPLPPKGPAPSGVSKVDPLLGTVPIEVVVDSGVARDAVSGGAAFGGAEPRGVESEGARSGAAEPGVAEPGGAEPAGVEPRGAEPEGVEPEGAESEGVEPGGADSEFAESGGAEPRAVGAGDSTAGDTGAGGVGTTLFGGSGVTAGAGGTGAAGTRGAGVRGARAGGTGAGGARAGGAGAGETGAVGAGAGDPGAGGARAGGAGVRMLLIFGCEEMSQGSGDAAEKRNEPPPSKIEALDGSNYEERSGWMRSAIKRYKLLKLAMGEEKMPEEGDARDRWIEKSAMRYDLILQSINNDMFEHIKDLPNTLPIVIVLEKELAALSMRPGDDVKPVLDKIKDTYARMAAAGSNVSQMQHYTKIISVLDNSWDNLIPTLNTQQDQWIPEWRRQQILQEDFRRCHTGGGAANKTAEGYGAAGGSRGRGGGRGRGRGRGFGRGRGRGDYNEGHGSSGGRGSTRMEGACYYCTKAGHPWCKCFSRPEGWAPPGMKPPSGERARGGAVQGSGAQGKANPGMFLMVEDVKGSEGDVGSVGKVVMHPLTHWVIDSGCTSHMTPRADLLDEVKPPGKIKFAAAASDALLPVIGVGNAKVMGANGGLVGPGNVLLVEGLFANLLSVRRLQKSKAKVNFGPTSCRAKLGKLLLWDLEEKSSCIKDLWQLPIIPWNEKPPATVAAAATAKTTAGGEETAPTDGALDAVKKVQQSQQPHGEVLAGVDATAAWAKASSRNGDADWETWHERLCLINIPMLQKLVKDGSLKALEVKGAAKEIGSCPTCLETKFTKFPFSSGTGLAKTPLALVHMDVVGPMRAPSLSASRYFLTIVDGHTRAVWVYPLKTKGEVAAAVLKEWMPRAQRESGHKVKVIRTDNGGEFFVADFESVLKKKGIPHQLTVPYNPQQNGVAERFNRTLQEGARTLLGRAGLPDPFWVTALWQVALVKNMVLATVGDKYQQLTVSRDVKFLESLYYKEWKQQLQKLPTTPLIIEADELQRPSRQVQVTVSKEEISGMTGDGGEPEVEEQQQQQQQQDAPQGAARSADRPRRNVRPPNRLTYPSFGKPKVVRARSVAEQCDEEEIAQCYWAAVPEPKTLAEALSGPDAEKWKQSVKEEYDSLLENETWELCELPPGKKAISSKLIFRVYRLKKAIYGLKQAPRAWYHKLEETLLSGGFKKSECDHSLFLLQEKEQFLMLVVYVDDILLFSKSCAMIEHVEEMLEMQFKCSKMGDVKYYLGMHVERDLDKGVLRLH
ncbi:unnamed protein product [Closterium sp. NIES-54]